jgi:phage gp36-like protein
MTIAYLTPTDMVAIYEDSDLVEATNLRDSAADQINEVKLQAACDGANGIAYGYLAARYADSRLQVDQLPAGLLQAFRTHCAAIAWHLLDGSTEESRNKHQDAVSYFQWFSKEDRLPDSTPGVTAGSTARSMAFEPGRQAWGGDRYQGVFGTW